MIRSSAARFLTVTLRPSRSLAVQAFLTTSATFRLAARTRRSALSQRRPALTIGITAALQDKRSGRPRPFCSGAQREISHKLGARGGASMRPVLA